MMVVITYDVNTETIEVKRRLRKVAKECMNYGQRVQNSVFECIIDDAQFRVIKFSLEKIIEPRLESLRFYKMGKNYENKIEHIGAKGVINLDGPLIL